MELKIAGTLAVCIALGLLFSCQKTVSEEEAVSTKVTGGFEAEAVSCSFPFSDHRRGPDIALKSNVHDADYINNNYPVTVNPIRLTNNYVATTYDSAAYGWEKGAIFNRVGLFCLTENVAPRDWDTVENNWSLNDWLWDETRGRKVTIPSNTIMFDGLFRFDMFEKINGYWHGLYSDYKHHFFPSIIEKDPYIDSMLNPFGVMQRYWNYYNYPYRHMPAQSGDVYFNPIRLPPHDGIYNTIATFNPDINGCRVVKEGNGFDVSVYNNNYFLAPVKIEGSTITVVDEHAAILPATSFTGTVIKKNKTISFNINCPYMDKVYHVFKVRDSNGNVFTNWNNQFELPISPPFKTDYWVKVVIPELGESVEIKCVKN